MPIVNQPPAHIFHFQHRAALIAPGKRRVNIFRIGADQSDQFNASGVSVGFPIRLTVRLTPSLLRNSLATAARYSGRSWTTQMDAVSCSTKQKKKRGSTSLAEWELEEHATC
jgi:hypothetical protein